MNIRKANDDDCQAIYELHVASIEYYCSPFYPKNSIAAWVKSKSIGAYKNILETNIIIVAEENRQIVGFGLLNSKKKSIDSLYI